MSSGAIAITGMGCVTPVGLSAPATCAALRAGIGRLAEFEGWADDGELPEPPFLGGRVPLEWFEGGPDEEWPGHERWDVRLPRPRLLIAPGAERLVSIALPAAREAWAAARLEASSAGGIGCYLGLDEPDRAEPICDALAAALGVRFEVEREDRLGRASGIAALHRAARHLREGRVKVALVGALDSRLRRATIESMLELDTLRTDDNTTGVVPGEAAAFLVLESGSRGRRPPGWLEGSGIAEEPTAVTDEPNRGEGLTQAVRRAREAARRLEHRPLVVNDLNGERYRAIEWGLVNPRALGDLQPAPGGPTSADMWHPADCIGDCGAASGGVNAIWALTAMRKGYACADRALVWGASDGALRAAALLTLSAEG